jgi:Rps23 Pro-64 3,4-dihydroxylase Tpa1-like proline 4-hydroxylase
MKFKFVEPEVLGLGIVAFRGAIEADWDFLMDQSWITANGERDLAYTPTVMPDTGEEAFINKSGFYYAKNNIDRMPRRATILHTLENKDLATQLDFLEESRDKCLMQYMEIYPHAYKTVWWKIKGHVVIYTPGTHLGPHSDIGSEFIYGVSTPSDQLHTRTVITAIIYLNDMSDRDTDATFSGGEHVFNYSNLTYQPKAGDVLLFPTTYTATHEVMPVNRGRRFSYLGWYCQGTPNPEVKEYVHHPSEIRRENNCTNVYMPNFRSDYLEFLRSRGHDKTSEALRVVERLAYLDE